MKKFWSLGLLLFIASAVPALADREPTRDEHARIELVLRAEGFQRWEEIELDDGVWEVDDAIDRDGRKWDLELDPKTLRIVKREQD